jgi:DNA-binding beta-propeller fold protein YncE
MRIVPKALVAAAIVLAFFGCSDISLKGVINQELGLSGGNQGGTPGNTSTTIYVLYVTDYAANTISAYTVNTSTGALTPVAGSPFATGVQPNQIAVDPKGNFLYVSMDGPASSVAAFAINPSNGALTPIGGTVAAGLNPQGIAVDPTGKFVYIANGGSSALPSVGAYTINQGTGALTPAGTINTSPITDNLVGITVDSTGQYVYVTDFTGSQVFGFSINPGNGMLTALNGGFGFSQAAANGLWGIAADPAGGYVYAANQSSGSVSGYFIGGGGLLSQLPSSPYPIGGSATTPKGIVVDPTGKFVYVANNGTAISPSVSAYMINTGGGLVSLASSPFYEPLSVSPYGIAEDPTGKVVCVSGYNFGGISNSLYSYTVTSGTGALTTVSGSPILAGVANPGIAIATVTNP